VDETAVAGGFDHGVISRAVTHWICRDNNASFGASG
jgi:hypothetical protein